MYNRSVVHREDCSEAARRDLFQSVRIKLDCKLHERVAPQSTRYSSCTTQTSALSNTVKGHTSLLMHLDIEQTPGCWAETKHLQAWAKQQDH